MKYHIDDSELLTFWDDAAVAVIFKFNKDQPRWPKGTPGGKGGQWRDLKSFSDYAEADAWGKEHWNDWARRLSPEQMEQIVAYTNAAGQAANAALRRDQVSGYMVPRLRDQLDAAFESERARMPQDTLVHRDYGKWDWLEQKFADEELVGAVFRDKGYTSTTLDPAQTLSPGTGPHVEASIHAEIIVPKDYPAMYMNADPTLGAELGGGGRRSISQWNQAELLLPRDTKFRVLEQWTNDLGRRKVRMEVVRDGERVEIPPEEIVLRNVPRAPEYEPDW